MFDFPRLSLAAGPRQRDVEGKAGNACRNGVIATRILRLSVFLLLVLMLPACDSAEPQTVNSDPLLPEDVRPEDYTTTASGLRYFDLKVGEGISVRPQSIVQFHYVMWLEDDRVIDTSLNRGSPATVVLGEGTLIPGMEEGMIGIRVGGSRQLIVPPDLAYGAEGVPNAGIPPNATFIVGIALLDAVGQTTTE
ncbi:MAG: FKBP-type peptidyl-prolyl cis-trans isomerase [Rhodothermales bacterium]|nr:FKBP-type peptidyl-prolyl cis-trans isomerase [Rhodothermales bacterium]